MGFAEVLGMDGSVLSNFERILQAQHLNQRRYYFLSVVIDEGLLEGLFN